MYLFPHSTPTPPGFSVHVKGTSHSLDTWHGVIYEFSSFFGPHSLWFPIFFILLPKYLLICSIYSLSFFLLMSQSLFPYFTLLKTASVQVTSDLHAPRTRSHCSVSTQALSAWFSTAAEGSSLPLQRPPSSAPLMPPTPAFSFSPGRAPWHSLLMLPPLPRI